MIGLIREAGVREVMISNLHDIPYSLMRRLKREIPGLRFVDESTQAPEAMLFMRQRQSQPILRSWKGGSEYRLVGDGVGDCLYLPAARVAELGWETRLPVFAGWSRAYDFSWNQVGDGLSEPVHFWREIEGAEARIEFHEKARGRIWLEMDIASFPAGTVDLRVSLNGEAVAFPASRSSAPSLNLGAWVSVREGLNELVLRPGPDRSRRLLFFSLRIADRDPHGAAEVDSAKTAP